MAAGFLYDRHPSWPFFLAAIFMLPVFALSWRVPVKDARQAFDAPAAGAPVSENP